MQRLAKITAFQMYCALTLSIGLNNHVLQIPVLLQLAKRDAWAGVACSFLPAIVWTCMLYAVVKRTGNRKLTEMLKQRFGKAVGTGAVLMIGCYCLVHTFVTLHDMVNWTKVSYLPQTPKSVIGITFAALCFFAAKAGIRAIAITSGLLLPGVVLLGLFVMSANFQYKDYTLLLPLFTHGYMPAIKAGFYSLGGSLELVLILAMQQHLSSAVRISSLLGLSAFLIVLTLGPLIGAIAIFGLFEAASMRYPAFEQRRMVQIGKYLSHLDFFSIYQWISGAFIRVSLLLFLAVDVTGFEKRSRTKLLAALCAVILALTLFPWDDMTLLRWVRHALFPVSFGMNLVLFLFLFAAIVIFNKRKEETGDAGC
ncbi:GerAB/ArcD/ProY family transporter [Paenibacillus hamazuiensis]|uniref:GerAB/ArcD/ProY family transporter n=1 Tax=Paenibacillus hamazuiensis TaxID=2936508 RepID=UPI00200FE015|nr:endospore germination permease [Paenibacillus hamazuiensis]